MTLPEHAGSNRVGIASEIPIRSLRLDSQNPRLPESHRGGTQSDLAVVLEMGFDAFAVAQSIADLGFFSGEPLLAIPSAEEDGVYVVVEGNRRLTALIGLADPTVRAEFAEPGRWEDVAGRGAVSLDSLIPVVVHSDRPATHAQVARAHVVGKLSWKPYMQARFIAARVAEGLSVAEVAELIGITKTQAGNLYRDQAVVIQAQQCGLATSEVEKAFSLLTVAMGNTKLRDHVGAPLGSQFTPGTDPIPEHRLGELRELIGWIFGTEEDEPKINDSRQMSQLGNVVASEVGLRALRNGATLEDAKQQQKEAGMDPLERLIRWLTTGKSSLLAASNEVATFAGDAQVQALLSDVEAVVDQIRSVIDEIASGSSAS